MSEEEEEEEEETSDIAGVGWDKRRNKWIVHTTKKGIHSKNADGEWGVWNKKPEKYVGLYNSKAGAEAAFASEQEALGRQWCTEVEATKNLPYLPFCRSRLVPPADWEPRKRYATIYFGDKGGYVGPQVVTISKLRIYTGMDGVERQHWQTKVSQTAPPPPPTSSKSAVAEEEQEEEDADAEKTSDIQGVSLFARTNKWCARTTSRGIHPKNADGEWTVWSKEPSRHIGYYASKAEAEAVYAPEQEARGKQWCAEVEATKDLPYFPFCRARIEPPADWVQGKKYATIHFGEMGGSVGPVVVTVAKLKIYTNKKGVERQRWQTLVSRAAAPSPPPATSWMGTFPAEYRVQSGLPQTLEAFADQKKLDARGYTPKYKKGKHGCCNGLRPEGVHCDTMCKRTSGGLYRCEGCGGPPNRGLCVASFVSDAGRAERTCKPTGPTNHSLGNVDGHHWAGRCCSEPCATAAAQVIKDYVKGGIAFPRGFVAHVKKDGITDDCSFDFDQL